MIEIPTQILDSCPACRSRFGLYFLPMGDEAVEKAKEYKLFQIVKAVFKGVRKPRSILQLNRFFGKCAVIAANTEDKGFNSKEKVAEQIKIALNFVISDLIIVKPNGDVHVPYRSIAFKNLHHMDACRFFDRADDEFYKICQRLGIDTEILEKESRKGE